MSQGLVPTVIVGINLFDLFREKKKICSKGQIFYTIFMHIQQKLALQSNDCMGSYLFKEGVFFNTYNEVLFCFGG